MSVDSVLATSRETLVDVLSTHAAERPSAVAIEMEGERVTFAELGARARRVAAALWADGVGAGARIAIHARSSIAHFELLYGAAMAGAVLVPVNWRLAPREVAEVLADSTAELVFVDAEFADVVEQLRSAGSLVHLRRVIVLTDDFALWRDRERSGGLPPTPVLPSAVVLQMYTSGTTGLPKGVLVTHANLCTAAAVAADWGLDAPDARSLVCMPLFHMSGTSWALLTLFYGGGLVVLRDADPKAILHTIDGARITHALLVPTLLGMALDAAPAAGPVAASLRLVVYGGSPIAEPLLRRALDRMACDFIQLYGLTESTGVGTMLGPAEHGAAITGDARAAARLRSVGRPAAGQGLRVVEPGTDTDCAPGVVGEILLRSEQVTSGYWNKPEETRVAVDQDGWLHTGDAGYVDDDGYLFLHDRVKDMIVTGGENVYPAEVERVLLEHPAVADAAVVAAPDERWGERVTAVVVAQHEVSAGELVAHAKERLAGYKCPRHVEFVNDLPRNATGKVLRREIRERYWQGRDRRVG